MAIKYDFTAKLELDISTYPQFLAHFVGCHSPNSTNIEILECLHNVEDWKIASFLQDKFLHSDPKNYVANPFLPLDDSNFGVKTGTIFSQEPHETMEKLENSVPLIIGSNKDEGMTFLPLFSNEEFLKQNWQDRIPKMLIGKVFF